MSDVPGHSGISNVLRSIAAVIATIVVLASSPCLAEVAAPTVDPVRVMVKRLDLARYKATIKSLTRFGDRRQGTARNRAAIDWIEARLKSEAAPTPNA